MPRRPLVSTALLLALSLLLLPHPAWPQLQTGNLYGEVTDEQGNPLPGAIATLSGIGASKVQPSNAEGQFRFLNLDPGTYSLAVELAGFATVKYPDVEIRVGRGTSLAVGLTPSVEEVITVTSQGPLLDERKLGAGTTVTAVELEKLPTSRDPWGLLHQAPGVQLDRVNVGGNESGQQSLFIGTGSSSNDNVFAVDGVVITDMSAIGASPGYYDFDAFEEVQLSTGGTDISLATGGVTVNLVTKRGTNSWRGSGRLFYTDSDLQSSSGFDTAGLPPAQREQLAASGQAFQGDEIERVSEGGVELGGDLIHDRLWVWGAWAEQDVSNLTTGGVPDATTLENSNAKLNVQLTPGNSGLFQFSRGDKIVDGRGAGPQRPPETTWDQSGPAEVWKLEDTHVFSPRLYLTGLWSYVDAGFTLDPKGGTDTQVLLDATGVFRRTFAVFGADRDVDQWRLDGSYFFNTGATAHEVRFGAGLREADTAGGSKWGSGAVVFEVEGAGGTNFARVYRGERPSNSYTTEYRSLWLQDTLSRERLTVNLGLRYDAQRGRNNPFTLAGSPLLPELLPTLDFAGNDAGGLELTSLAPRLGLTYALGDRRQTLLRASYSRFAQQLQQDLVERVNPLAPAFAFVAFADLDADLQFDAGEPYQFLSANGFDPAAPTALTSPHRNAPDLGPELIDEVQLGVEHAFARQLTLGLGVTWRRLSDLLERAYLVRDAPGAAPRPAVASDFAFDGYVVGAAPDGTYFSTPTWALVPEFTGGYLVRNGDREQDYLGLSLSFAKPLAERWMVRGYLNYADRRWDVPASYFFDANDLAPGQRPETDIDAEEDFDDDDAPVAEQSVGPDKADVLVNSRWSFNVNGMYQVAPERPWGFNVAANVYGREGYPLPYYLDNFVASDGIQRDLQVSAVNDRRAADLYVVDARLEKEITFGDFALTLSVDAFNLFNAGTVLQRERNLYTSRSPFLQGTLVTGARADFVDEILNPRIFRLGVRFSFR